MDYLKKSNINQYKLKNDEVPLLYR